MKPVAFDYRRPADLATALAHLAEADGVTKILAGGQSLGPMLNLRLVRPDHLVDITAIPELKRVEEEREAVVVGACVTHADLEDGRVPDVTQGALPAVAVNIAYRAVRNRGTIGGSLVHADPAADWLSSLAAIGAQAIVVGPSGQRTLPVEDLMLGVFEVALEPAELLEAIRIPRLSRSARWGYFKTCRKAGEFAHAIGVVLVDRERDVCRAVIGAIDAKPIVIADARALFGGRLDTDFWRAFDPAVADGWMSEAGLDDPVDRQIHRVALRRAAEQAGRA